MDTVQYPIGKVTNIMQSGDEVHAKIAGRWYRVNKSDLSADDALTSIQDFVAVDGELKEV